MNSKNTQNTQYKEEEAADRGRQSKTAKKSGELMTLVPAAAE